MCSTSLTIRTQSSHLTDLSKLKLKLELIPYIYIYIYIYIHPGALSTILGSWFWYRSCFLVMVPFLIPVLFLILGYGTVLDSGTVLASWLWYRSWFWYRSCFLVMVPFLIPVLFLVLGCSTVLVPIGTNLTYLILSPHIMKTLHIIIYSMVKIFQQKYTSSKLTIPHDSIQI